MGGGGAKALPPGVHVTVYIGKRVLISAGMLILISMLIFLLLRLAPGNPIDAYINPSIAISQKQLATLRSQLGLDGPLTTQYLAWLGNVLRGNFGYSAVDFRPVSLLIAERAGPTLLLMGSGILLAVLVGTASGVIAAVWRNTVLDYSLAVLAFLGIATPAFLAALIGMYVFAVRLHWFPAGGYRTPGQPLTAGNVAEHLILPAVILSLYYTATIMRYTRAALLEVLNLDYVRTARAKWLPEWLVILRHGLRNALVPVVTLIGASVGSAVGGAIFIESVFGWPGMGLLFIDAVDARNYPVIMGISLVIGVGVLCANLLTDVTYVLLDPRIQYG